MDNPPDFIHLFFRQFWRILKMDYPSLVWKRPLLSFWCVFYRAHLNVDMYAFLFWSTFKSVFIAQRISMDGRPKRIKMYTFSNENALVRIRPRSTAYEQVWSYLLFFLHFDDVDNTSPEKQQKLLTEKCFFLFQGHSFRNIHGRVWPHFSSVSWSCVSRARYLLSYVSIQEGMSRELNISSAVDSYLSPLKIEIVVFYWSIQGRK